MGITLGKSYDNEPYVTYVREDEYFLTLFNDLDRDQLATLGFATGESRGGLRRDDDQHGGRRRAGSRRRGSKIGSSRSGTQAPIALEHLAARLRNGGGDCGGDRDRHDPFAIAAGVAGRFSSGVDRLFGVNRAAIWCRWRCSLAGRNTESPGGPHRGWCCWPGRRCYCRSPRGGICIAAISARTAPRRICSSDGCRGKMQVSEAAGTRFNVIAGGRY